MPPLPELPKKAPPPTIWLDFEEEDEAGCFCSFISNDGVECWGAEIQLDYGDGTPALRKVLALGHEGGDPIIKIKQKPERTFEIRFIDRAPDSTGHWVTRVWLDAV